MEVKPRTMGEHCIAILHMSFEEIEVQRNYRISPAIILRPCYLGNSLNTTFLGPVILSLFSEKRQVSRQVSSTVSSLIHQEHTISLKCARHGAWGQEYKGGW